MLVTKVSGAWKREDEERPDFRPFEPQVCPSISIHRSSRPSIDVAELSERRAHGGVQLRQGKRLQHQIPKVVLMQQLISVDSSHQCI